jgi:hypothetical protein
MDSRDVVNNWSIIGDWWLMQGAECGWCRPGPAPPGSPDHSLLPPCMSGGDPLRSGLRHTPGLDFFCYFAFMLYTVRTCSVKQRTLTLNDNERTERTNGLFDKRFADGTFRRLSWTEAGGRGWGKGAGEAMVN